jgi:ATP-dependent Clp protease ATP-binding subunit ClpB
MKIEIEALRKEKDAASKDRLQKLETDLKLKTEECEELNKVWKKERAQLKKTKDVAEKLEARRVELQLAQRRGDLAKAGELMYGAIPELEKQLPKEGDELNLTMVSEAVTPRDIALVISRATGIPAQSLLLGEKEKLLKMEQVLSSRVIGQERAITSVSNAVRISRAGLHSHDRPLGSFLFLGPTGVGK